jgi:signal transduction histidine kinase
MLDTHSLVSAGGMGLATKDVAPSTLPWPLSPSGTTPDRAGSLAEMAALKRTQKEQSELMRLLVHELRSPVTTSKSMVATMRYLNLGDTQIDAFLARIENRMDQLLDLINDILALSQAKAGHPLGQVVALDLVAETRAVCKPYLEEAAASELAISVDLPTSPVWVPIVEQAYQLIVSNLVCNAVKYTPSGSVRITLRQEGLWAVLTVQDSGIGVPQAEIPQLFTEFFRASNARRSSVPGTGLGLAGVKSLVERFGGELEVTSEEGVGSCFTVRLPLRQQGKSPGISRNEEQATTRTQAHFYCIDPDPDPAARSASRGTGARSDQGRPTRRGSIRTRRPHRWRVGHHA